MSDSDLRKQLQSGFGESQWQDLAPHAGRDALIWVHPSLDLLMVGEAIATDNSALVGKWMAGTLLRKPTLEELDQWSHDAVRKFPTLIVQPFVLVQVEAIAA
ncbi:MAG: DUF2288 domain-containing protein [Limnothrix sp.]